MGIEQMRNAILSVYKGLKWKHKVDKMSDAQIIAVYQRFLSSGKFEPTGGLYPRKEKKKC